MSGTFTIRCEGCKKSETHPMMGAGPTLDKHIYEMLGRGWMRRQFGPPDSTANPWFCSTECAYESYAATEAAAYWKQKEYERQVEFEHYCHDTKAMPYLVFVLSVFSLIMLGGYLARL